MFLDKSQTGKIPKAEKVRKTVLDRGKCTVGFKSLLWVRILALLPHGWRTLYVTVVDWCSTPAPPSYLSEGEQLKAFPRLPCSQESGCDKSPPSHPVQSEKADSRGESEDIFVLLLVFLLVVVAWFRSCQEIFQCHWRLLDLKRGRNPLVFCFHGFGIVPQNSAPSFFLQPS